MNRARLGSGATATSAPQAQQKQRQGGAKTEPLDREFLVELTTIIVSTLILIAGLGWSETFKTVLDTFFPGKREIAPLVLYSTVVTLLSVVAITLLFRFGRRANTLAIAEAQAAGTADFDAA